MPPFDRNDPRTSGASPAPTARDVPDDAGVVVADLVKSFGSVRAVDGMTWSARRGRITTVLGPNGAGKTTAIGCLLGLLRPDEGSVRVLGTDPWQPDAEHRARVGVMLQDGGLPNTSGARRLLTHLARLYEHPEPPEAVAQRLIDRLGIEPFARTPVRRLSGGQRQHVALAAALVGRPEVAFLDEPTAGLDPHARLATWQLLRSLRDEGVTIVVTTHSFEEAERLADDVVIVCAGRVAAQGTLAQVVRSHPGGSDGRPGGPSDGPSDRRGGRDDRPVLEQTYFALTGGRTDAAHFEENR